MLAILRHFAVIDYCNDYAFVGDADNPICATNYFSEMPGTPTVSTVAASFIRHTSHYELPPVRPNTLYIVPLHVFLDLEAHSDRIDYITPVRETRTGTEVYYSHFRVSARRVSNLHLVNSMSLPDNAWFNSPQLAEIIKNTAPFYKLFLK